MSLSAVPGIRVGHAEVPGGRSGCTVVLGPFRGAVEVRGMATGTRELGVLSPHHLAPRIDALLLTGGSAFGLAAAEGVVQWLAQEGRGFDTGSVRVPLVPGAVIFDLVPGVPVPGAREGRRAVEAASKQPVSEGRVGAGAGARVGKLLGPSLSWPGGIGTASTRWRDWMVGALAVVNALGDVVASDGRILGGVVDSEGRFLGSDSVARSGDPSVTVFRGTNTTLAVVATDAPLSHLEMGKLARMSTGAFPRAVSPVHTPFDGDLLFALSTAHGASGFDPGHLMGLGVVARDLVEESIRRGVAASAEPDFPSHPTGSG